MKDHNKCRNLPSKPFSSLARWFELACLCRRSPNRIQYPTSAEKSMLGKWLATMLSRGSQVLHHRWISGNVHHMCLCQEGIRLPTLALWNREEMSSKVKNRGISGPTKEHTSTKNFIKTKLHCSGMRTICCSGCPGGRGLPGGVCPESGVCLGRDVCPGGLSAKGVCLWGFCPGE